MLVEDDGQFDEAYAISRSQQMSNRPPLSVVANPPLPPSRGDGKGGGVGGVGVAGTAGVVGGLDRQQHSMYESSGWIFVPPPPTSTSAVVDPRMGNGAAAAAHTVPLATATVLGNVPVCAVMPMTTIPSPALAQEEGVRDGGGNSGTNDALPVWSIKCGKFVKIGLALLLLVAATVIITVVVMSDGFKHDNPVPIVIVDGNGTSDPAIVTGTTSTDLMGTATKGTVPGSVSTDMGVALLSWKQQGTTILGNAAYDEFGNSVALSSDASIMAIGAPYNNDYAGYVRVYRTDADGRNRVQLGQTIDGDAIDDDFGHSVDITPDGMTIICGSPGWLAGGDRPGYVRVFSLEGDSDLGTDNWTQIGQDIIGEENGDKIGYSVSISGDGKTVAVGAYFNEVDSGHVRMYHLVEDGTSWQKIGQDIDGESAGDWLGRSVSLSTDGSTVAIGAPWNDNNGLGSGQVTVYRIDRERSSWERLGQSIYGDNASDTFGWSVNLSPDGNTLAIGSPYGGAGYVRVFSLTNGEDINDADAWMQIGQVIVGDADGDAFGASVSLSDDGKTLAVGASYAEGRNIENSGRVSVYRMDESEPNWIQIGDDIDGEAAWDLSGTSVSLSADGNKVVIGTPFNDINGYNSGHVRVYALE
jgi:hypothetical protein